VKKIQIIPLRNIPLISEEVELSRVIIDALQAEELDVERGDILVVTHKLVSAAEGRIYDSSHVQSSKEVEMISEETSRSPLKVAIALQEAKSILRREQVLITETQQGIITDYSGVDEANAPEGTVVALPKDPDSSALKIHTALKQHLGFEIPVIITDTQGRPWRKGAVNYAIGLAGMSAFVRNKGKQDLYGKELKSSLVCLADELASAAELVMGQADEGIPVVLIRGVNYESGEGNATDILRERDMDLYR
jgi:coenzyme F420-0:L-glutamate ligase/coenzyme F420-1:gamma-L-glutamate ligase